MNAHSFQDNLVYLLLINLVRISGSSSLFPAIGVFSAHLPEGAKALRLLRKERKTQKSSQISQEKVKTRKFDHDQGEKSAIPLGFLLLLQYLCAI